jgi:mycofactocin system creatininase family protein
VSQLGSLLSSDLAETDQLLVVPLGATEQHGPHLPLDTDTTIAVALADRLANRRDDVMVAPAIPYGSSGEHQGFPGTLSVGQGATELMILELVRSATQTFNRVLLLNAHGGNAVPLAHAVRRLRAEGREVRGWNPAAVWSGDAHAGLVETSVMLVLAPETVDMTAAEAGSTAPLADLLPALARDGVAAVSANGVLGDPTGASVAYGEKLLTEAVEALTRLLALWPVSAASAVSR